MALSRQPSPTLGCISRALCGYVLWATLIAEVSSKDPSLAQGPHSSDAWKLPAPRKLPEEGSDAAGNPGGEAKSSEDAAAKPDESAAAKPDESAAELEKTKAELLAAKSEVSRLQSEAEKATEKAEGDQAEQKKLTDQLSSQETQIAGLKSQIDTATREKTEVDSRLQALENEKYKLSQDLDASKASVTELTTNLNSKTDDFDKASKELSSTQATLADTQKDLENAREELKKIPDLEQQLTQVKTDLEDSRSDMKALESQHVREKTVADLEKEKSRKELQDLRKEHLALHASHDNLNQKYADPSVQHFLKAKAIKVYNDKGIQGARNKTFIYVLPTLQKRYDKGKQFVKASETAVYSKLNAYVGTTQVEPWLPAITGTLVYGSIIVPFICTVCCLTRIVCKLRPLLLFCHVDFLLTSLCAGAFALYTGKEPLAAFAHHDAAVYLFTQVIFAVVYILYFVLLVFAYCISKGDTSEGRYRVLQIVGAVPIMLIYYWHVWTPAMLDEMPKMDELVTWVVGEGAAVSRFAWLPYLPLSLLFLVLLRLERLSWHASGATVAAAKADPRNQMKIEMKNDLELATFYGEGDWGSTDWGEDGAAPTGKDQ